MSDRVLPRPDAGTPTLDVDADLVDVLGRGILGTLDHAGTAPDDHLALVRRTAEAEDAVRTLLRQAVGAARAHGHSWASIGDELHLSRQAVQQRFGDGRSRGST